MIFVNLPPPSIQEIEARRTLAPIVETVSALSDSDNSQFSQIEKLCTVNFDQDSASAARRSSIFKDAETELAGYEQFARGWDGYGGHPFSSGVITIASFILDQAERVLRAEDVIPDEVTPGPASDGSVDLEFLVGARRLIFTLYSDNLRIVRTYRELNDESVDEQVEPLTSTSLAKGLSWVVGSENL